MCVAARFRPGYTSTPMRVGLVMIACVCLSAACGKSASTQTDEPAPNGDPHPAAACSLPCRVVVNGLTRPTEMTAGRGYVYFVERGIRDDTFDGVVMRAPAKGGAAETLTAAPGILGRTSPRRWTNSRRSRARVNRTVQWAIRGRAGEGSGVTSAVRTAIGPGLDSRRC